MPKGRALRRGADWPARPAGGLLPPVSLDLFQPGRARQRCVNRLRLSTGAASVSGSGGHTARSPAAPGVHTSVWAGSCPRRALGSRFCLALMAALPINVSTIHDFEIFVYLSNTFRVTIFFLFQHGIASYFSNCTSNISTIYNKIIFMLIFSLNIK